MKIGIDISMLVYEGSGVATYTDNLVKSLLKYHSNNRYVLFYSSFRRTSTVKERLNDYKRMGAQVCDCRFPPRVLKYIWNKHHIFPVEFLIGKVDIYLSSDYLRPPLFKDTISFTTIHDLTWKIYPEFHNHDIVELHNRKMFKTLKYRDNIIVDSFSTKNDLTKYYAVENYCNLHVIHLGLSDGFHKIVDQEKIKDVLKYHKIQYGQDFILYVGAIEPRKNLLRLIDAFEKLVKNKKYSNYKLVLVGRAGWKNSLIFNKIKALSLKNKVLFLGYISDQDLAVIYSVAKVCAYVSLYEGFGLPPIEAQACGCPVVSSNLSSMPEILGDSAVLVNPLSISEIKTGIEKCIVNYDEYSKLGFKNVKRYEWKNVANELNKLFIKYVR